MYRVSRRLVNRLMDRTGQDLCVVIFLKHAQANSVEHASLRQFQLSEFSRVNFGRFLAQFPGIKTVFQGNTFNKSSIKN